MPTNPPSTAYDLVIDTATEELSVAVLNAEHAILAHTQKTVWRDMGAQLQPTILDVLKQSDINFTDLSALYINLGPGSFTSIRIGLASVRAMSFALGIPAYGASGLAALAAPHKGKAVALCLKAVGQDVYWQTYNASGRPETDALCLPLEQALSQCPQGALLLTNLNLRDYQGACMWQEVVAVSTPAPVDVIKVAQGSGHSRDLQPYYIRALTYKKQIA